MIKGVKRTKTLLLPALAGLCLLTLPVVAQAAEDDISVPVPPVLEQFKQDGGSITFMGHEYGVDGWRVTDATGEKHQYAYTTPEGGVIMGVLVRPDGTFATREQTRALNRQVIEGSQEALPGADKAHTKSARVEKLYAAVEKSAWVGFGAETAPYIYVFMNVHCDHCQNYWNDLKSAVAAGQLQVRLIPFGKLDINRRSGAALLSASNPRDAWDAFMNGGQAVLDAGMIAPGMEEQIDLNTALVNEWNLKGPPFTLYRRPSDGQLVALVGRAENPMLLISDVMKKGQ